MDEKWGHSVPCGDIVFRRPTGNWQKRRQYEGYAVEWPNPVVK